MEEELKKKLMIQQIQDQQQKKKEEILKQREQEIVQREINVMQRELFLAIIQQNAQQLQKPTPIKRKGRFKHKALGKKELGSEHISMPSGTQKNICILVVLHYYLMRMSLLFTSFLIMCMSVPRFSSYAYRTTCRQISQGFTEFLKSRDTPRNTSHIFLYEFPFTSRLSHFSSFYSYS